MSDSRLMKHLSTSIRTIPASLKCRNSNPYCTEAMLQKSSISFTKSIRITIEGFPEINLSHIFSPFDLYFACLYMFLQFSISEFYLACPFCIRKVLLYL